LAAGCDFSEGRAVRLLGGWNRNPPIFDTVELHRAMKGQIEIERTFTTIPGDLADTLADTITFADAFALFGYDCSLTKRGNSARQQH